MLYIFLKASSYEGGLVGSPVRTDIANLPTPAKHFTKREGRLEIPVVGGSLGAGVLDKAVPQVLTLLPDDVHSQMYHQSGRSKLGNSQADYGTLSVEAECMEFITDTVPAYRDVDLMICRVGALTIAELMAVGLDMLLMPYPYAVDDHQTANTRFMV